MPNLFRIPEPALDGLPGDRRIIADEAVDRHITSSRSDKVATRWAGRDGARRDLTYGDPQSQSNRFANALRVLGIAVMWLPR